MKLATIGILTILTFVSVTRAEVETDEMDIDDEEVDELEDEIPAAEPETPQATLSQTPLEGIRSFAFFPEGAHTITGGKLSELVIGVQNNGESDIQMARITGRIEFPEGSQKEVVQNLTSIGYDNQRVASKQEASFGYGFVPHLQTGGRKFNVLIEIYYQETAEDKSHIFYKAEPFKETLMFLESTEGVATEMAMLYMTLVVLFIIGGFVFYNKFITKWLGIKPTSAKAVETGTSNNDVNMSWIPEEHKTLRKRAGKVDSE